MSSQKEEFEIVDPPNSEFDFVAGESRTLKYKINNNTPYTLVDIELAARTKKKVAKDKFEDTVQNYAKVIKAPTEIEPRKSADVLVEVNVPLDYNENVVKDNEIILVPFRVNIAWKANKAIKEL